VEANNDKKMDALTITEKQSYDFHKSIPQIIANILINLDTDTINTLTSDKDYVEAVSKDDISLLWKTIVKRFTTNISIDTNWTMLLKKSGIRKYQTEG
jgi:hypothetical protein